MTKIQRADIRVVGVVQGIGFRPFIYNLALKFQLNGFVLNTGNSAVQIIVEGNKQNIIEFIESIETDKPHLAVIDSINTTWKLATGEYTSFSIHISKNEQKAGGSIIPADIAICEDCIDDLNDSKSRHYNYPFTCCAICGPRYTTIADTPYDRERTTMEDFPLCEDCNKEFFNPGDRRYNAQTICCPICGPTFKLIDRTGQILETRNVFEKATKLLNEGAIIAIKGLGGLHLAVRASLESQIQRLRKLRNKPIKPLAIMSRDLSQIESYAIVTKRARELLTSWRKPIVVLQKKTPFLLAPSLSPGIDTIGVMLPYSGIYLRLFDNLNDLALVMTSANPAGLPTIIHADTFQKQFMEMADYLLTHNRTIYQRCDDSVVLPLNNHRLIIRRSRGYTPEPIETGYSGAPVLAVGALEKNTGALFHRQRIFLTQHIGDVDTIETLNFLQKSLKHLQNLLRVDTFDAIGCDLHPDFLTTQYAEQIAKENNITLFRIQHHHAHLAALQADYQLPPNEEIVAICCDGAGYGEDQTIWGGEILVGNASTYRRAAHLRPLPMPGGDLAAHYPLRMLVGILSNHYSPEELFKIFQTKANAVLPQKEEELNIAIRQIKQRLNSPLTSSTGRILDSISTLLDVCYQRTYEGEPAIRLEAFANQGSLKNAPILEIPTTKERNTIILETSHLVNQIFNLKKKVKSPDLALSAHISLAQILADTAISIARDHGIEKIGFSGGVAYNKILTQKIKQIIELKGLTFLIHNHVPPGDAGTSVGQALITRSRNTDN
jgi:hydrogenase maturation protein HypF